MPAGMDVFDLEHHFYGKDQRAKTEKRDSSGWRGDNNGDVVKAAGNTHKGKKNKRTVHKSSLAAKHNEDKRI